MTLLVLRSRSERVSVAIRRRSLLVSVALSLLLVVLGFVALCSGSLALPLTDVIATLTGNGDARSNMVVLEWRLPRAAAAVFFGAALGVSGALFQSLTRNPLGSPDVLGFDAGAVTGALVATLLLGAGQTGLTIGALAGGLLTAVVVGAFGLGSHASGASTRLIVVGIGVSAMLIALNQLLILRASLEEAMRASSWTLGSLDSIGWDRLLPATVIIFALITAAGLLGRPARMLELHGEASTALGVQGTRTRVSLLLIGVALTAVPVSVAGPIAFVALTAPHLARQLTRVGPLSVLPSALMGGLLLLAADLAVVNAPTASTLPVSIATLVLGGGYFIWLLVSEWRRTR